jgi:hypothetical protein
VAFEQGEAAARSVFETYVAAKMAACKKDRYGGWLGGFRWAKDKLFGMPEKVDEFYTAGRELYLPRMDGVISRVADIVGTDLKYDEEAHRHLQRRDRHGRAWRGRVGSWARTSAGQKNQRVRRVSQPSALSAPLSAAMWLTGS